MKITHFLYVAALFVCAASQATFQPESPFRVYSVADGLNQKTVLAVTQDHDGFLWIATFGGLNRFDGRDFESLTTRQGLRQNLIQALAVDRYNRLWAGDAAGGLSLIEDGRVTRTFAPEEQDRGVARSIIEVGDTLFVATQPGGLRTLSLTNLDDGLQTVEGAPSEILTLIPRENNELVLLSAVGLHIYRPDAEPAFQLIAENMSALQSDGSGRVAVGDKAGRIGWVVADTVEWLDLKYDGVVSALEMSGGEIEWVVLEGQGMVPFGDPAAPLALPLGGVAPSLYDQEGVLWVPARSGLARYLGSRFQHYGLELDGVKPEVFSISPGINGDHWFGTSLGLLHVDADGEMINVSDALGIERREIRDIRFSSDQQTLWFAQVRGPVLGIDPQSLEIKTTLGDTNFLTVSLEVDANDKVWYGSYIGSLSVYDPVTDTSRTIEIGTGASVYSLDMADDHFIWIAAHYKGLYRLDTSDADAQPEHMASDEDWNQEIYTHVVAQGAGADATVWFTSVRGGVFQWHDGQTTRVIPEAELADVIVYSIAPLPDNTLVLATSRGAYRYDLATSTIEHYNVLDGFVGIESKVHSNYFDGDRSLMIGTTGGVTVMDVGQPMIGVGTPKPMITARTVDSVDIVAAAGIPEELSVDKVLISFTAVSTRKPFGIEYSYRLTGQDLDWSVPAKNTSIGYSNLNPGAYQFEVRARLPGGEWSEPAIWSFDVPTPFWRMPAFVVAAILTLLALAWSIVQLRLRSIERVNRRLRREVAERTESIEAARAELEQTNEHLSSEMQERQKADALRAEVEARFHQAYQNSPIGMALVDTDGLVYDANPRMRALFWPDSSGNDRQPLIEVVAHADRESFSDFLDACAIETADDASMEVECRACDGEIRRIDFHPSAVRDHDGRLKYVVLLAHDVTESRAMTDQLEYQARFDELTGLVNRRAFGERLKNVGDEQVAARAYLMFLDLDQFKVVNDTCGHAAGDELLRQVSRILRKCVRGDDTVARLGGDEFALILVGCTQAVALERAEDVRQRIQDLEFLWEQDVFRIGVSIGVVPVSQSTRDLNELQQLADAACYAAKEAGRNRVHLVSGESDAAHEHRGEMRWVQRLSHAIDQDSFVLFGQKILALNAYGTQANRVEVLLRMRDRKTNRLIPPGAFLPAAERYGLQGRLDQWVVNNVLDVMARQDPAAVENQQFWVNLSGASVGDSNISQALIQSVEAANLPPGSLNFEITETAVIRKIDDAAALVQSLQAMGCRFALDDFGSGLSSFGYLKRLNVDCIKIDGQFVRDITTDPTDRIFVKSIIDIAHTLDMRVVAEFVEDEEILDMIRDLGSDYAQGFGIHRPEPLTSLVDVAAVPQAAQT